MKHRPATPADLDAIVDLAVESVSRDPLPVRISRDAMRETAKSCLAPSHFMWVAEQDGRVVAAVAACVQPSFWYERAQCSVLLYYSRVRGAGIALLRQFARWVKSRPAIKVAVMELEPGADPRLVALMKRLGFARESTTLSFVRGAA